ncbi:MAG: cytochrome C oxidase subunit IV family protein [Abitibacteriaceae bacterium]|nr:cytochrome C oxidase subunit IV family protein [Abditibacteriaceae bacterium]
MAQGVPVTEINEEIAHDVHGGRHIVPVSVYLKVFTALMVLLVITLAAAAIDMSKPPFNMPSLNIIIAMTIAVAKAVLIVLYFMEVRYSSRITWLFSIAGFAWLSIMFAFIFSDYVSRGWLPQAPR